MSEKIFTKGMYFNLPNDNAPEFVRGSVSINVAEFIPFLQENAKDGKVKLDLLVGKSGKAYSAVNTYQPQGEQKFEDDIPF